MGVVGRGGSDGAHGGTGGSGPDVVFVVGGSSKLVLSTSIAAVGCVSGLGASVITNPSTASRVASLSRSSPVSSSSS